MVSPVVLAFYTGAAVWLVLKYRYLISTASGRKAFDWRFFGELLNAIVIGVAVAVAPHLPLLDDNAWCPDIKIPPLSAAALLFGSLGPLFDPKQVHPFAAVAAAALTTAFLGVGSCWGLGSIVATTGLLIAFIRVSELNRFSNPKKKKGNPF